MCFDVVDRRMIHSIFFDSSILTRKLYAMYDDAGAIIQVRRTGWRVPFEGPSPKNNIHRIRISTSEWSFHIPRKPAMGEIRVRTDGLWLTHTIDVPI